MKRCNLNNIIDAVKDKNLRISRNCPPTTIVQEADNKLYSVTLPNISEDSDKKYLKRNPLYRLLSCEEADDFIGSRSNGNFGATFGGCGSNNNSGFGATFGGCGSNNNNLGLGAELGITSHSNCVTHKCSTTTTTTETPPTTLDLTQFPQLNEQNPDIQEFISLLNDVGHRIYFTCSDDFGNIRSTNNITQLFNSVQSNILFGINNLRSFLGRFGRKIVSPNLKFNPYHNSSQEKSTIDAENTKNYDCVDKCNPRSKIDYAEGPYNPCDINTYLNCIDQLIFNTTENQTSNDINFKLHVDNISNAKVSKLDDGCIDSNDVSADVPDHNPLILPLTLIKIDVLFMDILYQLNLHETFRSPITNEFYSKKRTKINDNGFPVRDDEVTNENIFSATVKMEEMLSCILQLFTFSDPDQVIDIMHHLFGVNLDNLQEEPDKPDVIPSGEECNIPIIFYGIILSFCDVSLQSVGENYLPLVEDPDNDDIDFNHEYDTTKVANVAINTNFAMIAILKLVELLIKSDAFITSLAMIFPTDILHSRSFGHFEEDRQMPMKDFLSLLLHAIFGENVSNRDIKSTGSIPSSTNADITIDINRYCKIYNLIAIISYYATGARTLILDLEGIKEQCFIDPFLDCTTSPETTQLETTINPEEETPLLNLFVKDLFVASLENRLQHNVSDSGSLFTKFEDYIKECGKTIQETYNARVDALSTTTVCHRNLKRNRKNKKDVFSILTQNVKF